MRSVVLKPSPRCGRCLLPPRWCICAAHREIHCPLEIAVLIQQRERFRPSSTGNLIDRLFPAARQHVWSQFHRPAAADVVVPGREVWILHPHGRPLPAGAAAGDVQVVLLDGSWSEASDMARAVASWGRLVSLPMTGASRFWLRAQQDGRRFSTVEALLFLLEALGLRAQHDALRVQFELHVYASLRARGRTDVAAEFLAGSILRTALPDLLAQMHTRRPHEGASSRP